MWNIPSRLRALRRNRGAAVVELSVLMAVLVPLTMLPLYFQDSMRYRLDLQEAVGQTVWDFAYQDYENNTAGDMVPDVTAFAQKIHDNLWSGNDKPIDSPTGPWANFNWVQGHEIDCDVDTDMGSDGYIMLSSTFHGKWTKGGKVTCSGQIAVENHYIPSQFFQEFSHDDVKFFAPEKNELVYPPYVAALMVDSWSVNGCGDDGCPREPDQRDEFQIEKGSKTGGAGGDAFYERTESMWKGPVTYWAMWGLYLAFIGKGVSDEIISPVVLITAFTDLGGLLDNPLKLKMAVNHDHENQYIQDVSTAFGPDDFYSLPYEDGEDDMPQQMLDARENNYLGCQGGLKPNC